MEKDVKLITSGIVLIILGLVFRPLFVQLGQVRPFILSIMWFPWALVAIGGFAFVLGILKLFGVSGFRTQGQHVVGNLTYKLSTINSFEFIRFISIFYCAVAIPALSIVYLMNYGKYNQTILLLCILGLNIFLISQIIFLFFRKRYNKYMPANAAITIQPRPTPDTTHTSEPWCNEAQLAAHSKAIPKNKKITKIIRPCSPAFRLPNQSLGCVIPEFTKPSLLNLSERGNPTPMVNARLPQKMPSASLGQARCLSNTAITQGEPSPEARRASPLTQNCAK